MTSQAIVRRIALLAVLSGLSACDVLPLSKSEPDFRDDDLPALEGAPVLGLAGGVFNPLSAWPLAADGRAYKPGDTLTVTLDETTQASKRAGTSFKKGQDMKLGSGKVLGLDMNMDSEISGKRSFDGSGSSSQQNTLRGEMTVVVHKVVAGGLLQVKGEKTLSLNQGEEIMRISGYVRPADVDTNNRVSSRRIANARIAYVGKGALADSNRPGWLMRLFNSPWMPF